MANAGNLSYMTRIDPATGKAFPAEGRRKVFISYKKSDNKLSGVRDIAAKKILSMVDCAVWYDENLTPGVNYEDEILKAITECDAVVLLLTREIMESDFVWNIEMKTALEQNKGIIPLAFDFPRTCFEQVELRLGQKLQILTWPKDGEDGEKTEDTERFDYAMQRALERFVINSDRSLRIQNFFNTSSGISMANVTPADRLLVGCAYLEGMHVEQNVEKGIALLDSVAGFFGDDEESLRLRGEASVVLLRHYMEQNEFAGARKYARLGVEAGNPEAAYTLGRMYRTGKGTMRDLTKAAELFEMGAAGGNAGAAYELGLMYRSGNRVEKNAVRAFELFREAAQAGSGSAMYELAEMYADGEGTEQNTAAAEEWFAKSAELSSSSAMRRLGKRYEDGDGVKCDQEKMLNWYIQAAELGDTIAMRRLGDMYESGEPIPRDMFEAFKWYYRSATNGNAVAMRYLGIMYYNGAGVDRDTAKAEEWFTMSEENGGLQETLGLARMFLEGTDVDADRARAIGLYRKAARTGSKIALEMLNELGVSLQESEDEVQAEEAVGGYSEDVPAESAEESAAVSEPVFEEPAVEVQPEPQYIEQQPAQPTEPAPAAPQEQPAAPLSRREQKAADKARKAAEKAAAKARKLAEKEAKKAARRK